MTNTKHTLKIEDVNITELEANRIVKAFKDFATEIGYGEDRISDLSCRSYDGFLAFDHNKGGIQCVAFRDQERCYFECTNFKNADETINEYRNMDVAEFEKSFGSYANWTEKQSEEFEDSRMSDGEASVMFGMDIMYKGKVGAKHSANIRITVCVKDAPYHRQYDDLVEIELSWKFHKELLTQLAETLKNKQVVLFSNNVEEAYLK